MNEQLRNLYRKNWDLFSEVMERGSSAPLLLRTSQAYRKADTRLLFVGQETQGWAHPEDDEDPIGELMGKYEAFRFGKNIRHTPFWKGVHQVREHVNPESSDAAILWSNLGKVDVDNDLPSEKLLGPLIEAEILPREIEITKPDAVVFFTGPTSKYDDAFRRTFEGVELEEIEPNLHEVFHPGLPKRSFRTYHPRYLGVLSGYV